MKKNIFVLVLNVMALIVFSIVAIMWFKEGDRKLGLISLSAALLFAISAFIQIKIKSSNRND